MTDRGMSPRADACRRTGSTSRRWTNVPDLCVGGQGRSWSPASRTREVRGAVGSQTVRHQGEDPQLPKFARSARCAPAENPSPNSSPATESPAPPSTAHSGTKTPAPRRPEQTHALCRQQPPGQNRRLHHASRGLPPDPRRMVQGSSPGLPGSPPAGSPRRSHAAAGRVWPPSRTCPHHRTTGFRAQVRR